MRRVFSDWCRPGLQAAADWLIERYASGGVLDLRNVIVALPGGRAGRRLLEVLVERAESQQRMLVPPRIITASALPEQLYKPKLPLANALTQHLAWIEALKEMDRAWLGRLIRHLPADDDLFAWLSVGEMLSDLHQILAADVLDCQKVIAYGENLPQFDEGDRWRILAEIQKRYLERLDILKLWDQQTARLVAIKQKECHSESDIILVGMVDMNRTLRQMLDQVADRVTALVFAPPDWADRFDEHGCVVPQAWQDVPVELDPQRIEVVDGPGDQADAAARALAALDGRYAADEIVVGVPDEGLVPYLEQRLEECEVPVRYGVGTPVTHSEPCRLLAAVAEFLEGHRFHVFADLVRHPAVERWLRGSDKRGTGSRLPSEDSAIDQTARVPVPVLSGPHKDSPEKGTGTLTNRLDAELSESSREPVPFSEPKGDWLNELDGYYSSHLPWRITGTWLKKDRATYPSLPPVYQAVSQLLAGFGGPPRPLSDWNGPIVDLLLDVYGSELDQGDPTQRAVVAACDHLREALREQQQVPQELAPRVTGAEAIRLALHALQGVTVPPPADESAVELLGWLELPLDDAPALIVTGFNEGTVPSSRNGDVFLPNELRRQLNLEDNDRRYARDVYALSLLAACKPDLRIIAGRRTADNDPLAPSRLLFTCDEEEIARRTLRLFAEREHRGRIVLPGSLRPGRERASFEPPRPLPLAGPVEKMRVTEFRDYLRCPYRYYLRQRLKLERLGDGVEELDGRQFGTLLHNVLSKFGQACIKNESLAQLTNADEIENRLNEMLDEEERQLFGDEPLPAVRVQIELLRQRLRSFAGWQTRWTQAGWRIRHVEDDLRNDASLDVDGVPLYLSGRIDRIDQHEPTDRWIIFDYKTGDSGKTPQQTHRDKHGWTDLQLPLYRHAAAWLEVGKTVDVGYIVLPKDISKIGEHVADWAAEEFEDAVQTAKQVVRNIRSEVFWPPTDPPPTFLEK